MSFQKLLQTFRFWFLLVHDPVPILLIAFFNAAWAEICNWKCGMSCRNGWYATDFWPKEASWALHTLCSRMKGAITKFFLARHVRGMRHSKLVSADSQKIFTIPLPFCVAFGRQTIIAGRWFGEKMDVVINNQGGKKGICSTWASRWGLENKPLSKL